MDFALPLIWAVILAFGVFMYVVLDGFDLGVGILFRNAQNEEERQTMMNTIAPTWDGNETWLILGGAGLLGAFPVAYSTILPALYLPLIVMLMAMIFRGVAFEFRYRTTRHRGFWDAGFILGSTITAFVQGAALGAFVQGFEVEGRTFVGSGFDWLTPFSVLTGLGLVAGYALLGCTWLIMRTEGALQGRAYRWSMPLMVVVVGFLLVICIWTPAMNDEVSRRWFTWPAMAYLWPLPVAIALTLVAFWRAVQTRQERTPFVLAILLFLLSYLGVAVSLWPYVVPPNITIWQAASPPESQLFVLVGALVLIPIVLAYTAFSYYVFRGKVRGDEGYH